MDGPSARRRGRGPKIRDTVAVTSRPLVAKDVMTKVVAFFDGGGARAAQMSCGASTTRRDGVGPEVLGRAGGSRGRDEIASVEKSSIPYLVVGRERHILGL